jgi:23S rRNA maturation-related 3'-5' exoribonuclease YhaM
MSSAEIENRTEGMMMAEQVIRRIAREYEERAGRAGSASERSHYEACAGVAAHVADAVRAAHAEAQNVPSCVSAVNQLASFLLRERASEMRPGESPVECAIRLLGSSR